MSATRSCPAAPRGLLFSRGVGTTAASDLPIRIVGLEPVPKFRSVALLADAHGCDGRGLGLM
jgi:hypothetical protein